MRIGIAVALLVSSLLALTSCGGGGGGDAPQTTPPTPGPVARLEVSPAAVLLTSTGQAQSLKVRAFDANGLEVPNPSLTFSSSAPTQITVSSRGVVAAASPVGSSLITVESGSIRAQPLLAVVAETQPGAIPVADDQVVAGPRPLAGSQPGVGGRYTVELSGLTPPVAGSLLIASGSYPIAGKVVDSTATPTGTVLVTLELVPLNQLFRNLSVTGQLTPSELAKFAKPADPPMPPIRGLGEGPSVKRLATAKFGVFECSTSFDPSLLNLSLTPTITQSLGFGYDFSVLSGVTKAFLLEAKGTIEASITGQATVFAATGSLDCAAPLLKITVPITGWLSAFVAPQVPLGVKTQMDLSASTNVSFGFNGFVSATVTFGIKQDALGRQVNINDVTTDGRWELSPTFANAAARVRYSNFGGIYAGLTVGNIWGSLPNAVEVSAGFETASAWGMPYDAARDPLFTTEDVAKVKASIGPGPGLQKLLDWASVVLSVDITFSLDRLLAQSPKQQSARVDRSSISIGDTINFSISLDPTTIRQFFGVPSYNVREVRIYKLDDQRQTAELIASVPAVDGQSEFTISWLSTFSGSARRKGKDVFFAFVVPLLPSVMRREFPIELGAIQTPDLYAEARSGDLSINNLQFSPLTLAIGTNTISGTAAYDSDSGQLTDYDVVPFTIPVGTKVTSVLATLRRSNSVLGSLLFNLNTFDTTVNMFGGGLAIDQIFVLDGTPQPLFASTLPLLPLRVGSVYLIHPAAATLYSNASYTYDWTFSIEVE